MVYGFVPRNWKRYVIHRGLSWNVRSILGTGLVPGGKEEDKARQAVSLTPTNLFGNAPGEEAPHDDYTVPQKVPYVTRWKHDHNAVQWVARGTGSSRRAQNRRRRTRKGPEPALCASTLAAVWQTRGREWRINVLPWYRPVGVVSTSSETHRREDWAARKGKWSPRGTGMTRECAKVTGKVGENGQYPGNGAARSSWTRPSAPRCGHTSKASASSCLVWGDPSRTPLQGRRLNVQSGLRKDDKGPAC